MVSSKRLYRTCWLFLMAVFFIFPGVALAAISEFRVNTYTNGIQSNPAVAMNDAGNFVVAWQSNLQDGSGYGIYAQRNDAGGNPVGPEFRVNTTTDGDELSPSVCLNAAGGLVVAWQSDGQDGDGYGIYARRFGPDGNPLGDEFKVNRHTAARQQHPAAAMNASGNFVIVWESENQDEAGGWGVYAQRYDPNGSPLGNEFRVNTYTASSQLNAAVSLNDAGNFVVTWQSLNQDGPGWGIYAQRFDPSGNPLGSEFKVNTYIAGMQQNPKVSLNTAGNFVIVWESLNQDGFGFGIYAQRFDPNGNLLGSEFKVNTHTANNQKSPAVSLNGAGNFVIAWESDLQDTSFSGIYAQRYDPSGNPLGSEFKVNTFTTKSQLGPSVSLNAAGNFVIAWHSDGQDGSGNGVYAQRFNADGIPQGLEFRVNTYTTGTQRNPAVVMEAQGRFVITWQSDGQDGSGNGVYAQRFDAAGNPLGSEFRVNTYTADNQDTPAVATNPEGRFIIVWESNLQDGSGNGVYAQRYDTNGNPVGAEFRVNTRMADSQDNPKVAMDREGNFVVVWISNLQDGSSEGIYAQRFDRNGLPQGTEFQVNAHTPDIQNLPDVAMDRDGNFVIAWQSNFQDGSGYGVYARRYDLNGNPQGDEFRINTYTDGDQGYPALAMSPHGQWLIVWESFGQDVDSWGVFMKLFKKNWSIHLPLVLKPS